MNLDRRLDNRTPMSVRCLPLDDRSGRPVVAVVAKMTYLVSPLGEARAAVPQVEVRLSDELHALPGLPGLPELREPREPRARAASIRYPGDGVDDKPGTDVIFVGTAYPPPGQAVTEMEVSVRVGLLYKALRVFGPRSFQVSSLGATVPGPAAPLGPTPLVYELAPGGYDDSDPERPVGDPRNPVGLGAARAPAELVGRAAPRIEHSRAVLGGRSSPPAGFGAIGPSWSPRRELAGTHDAAWRRDRAPFRPLDFDPRHHACAHPDLHSPAPLTGDEPVEVLGATPAGAWRFRLPAFAPSFRSRQLQRHPLTGKLESVVIEHPTHLDTYLVDGDRGAVELTWRASVRLPRKIDHLESIVVFASPELPEPVLRDLSRRDAPTEAERAP